MRYLGLRFLQSMFVLLGVSLLSFVFVELAPGNFFDEMTTEPAYLKFDGDELAEAIRDGPTLARPILSLAGFCGQREVGIFVCL